MDEAKIKAAQAAVAEVDSTPATPVTVTDTMPGGAAQAGGRPVTPVNAATMRFLQAIEQVEPELSAADQAYFALYCRVRGAGKVGRRELWRLAREPGKLWDAFLEWMDTLPLPDLQAMMQEHFPEWLEVEDARKIISDDADGGQEGNATGSPS